MRPDRPPIAELARGRWKGLLPRLGVPAKFLANRHGPCPMCGGKDRWRFDDKDGKGTWICSACGAGDAFKLLNLVRGWTFPEAAREVESIVGDVSPVPGPKPLSDAEKRARLRGLWKASQPTVRGDIVDRYLRSRGVGLDVYPSCLRTCERCAYGSQSYPAMLALVSDAKGRPATIHRTYLAASGNGKAPLSEPRKLMPGSMPDGGAIRLSEPAETMGIAEGIETALSASRLFGLPVWSVINAGNMQKWRPPAGVREVVVFGDCDPKYGGQAAAYVVAHRLATLASPVAARVEIPDRGDWNDALNLRGAA